MAEPFDRSRLSQREAEILDLAIDGMTDQQIALRLDISTSTVNSYWVRIRGKLGHLSRTELVAASLRQKAQADLVNLQAQSDRFEVLAQRRDRDDETLANSELYRTILESFPDAVLAIDGSGTILFANEALLDLLGYTVRELVGASFELLLAPRDRAAQRTKVLAYLRNPHALRLGIGKVIYARHKDGNLIRVVLLIDGRRTHRGTVVTCVIRSFVEEVDLARRRTGAILEDLLSPAKSEAKAPRTDLI